MMPFASSWRKFYFNKSVERGSASKYAKIHLYKCINYLCWIHIFNIFKKYWVAKNSSKWWGIGIFFSWWFICAKKRFVILATFHNTEMSKKLELCDLPQELLYDILVRIPDQNWLAFGLSDVNQPPSLTCKRWKALISTKNFWRRYHSYWQSKVPQKLFQSEQPWQYFASIRYTFAI